MKLRIARVRTKSAFGQDVIWYAIQRRVAFFWWVTIDYASQLSQARSAYRTMMKRGDCDTIIKFVKPEEPQ